MVSSLEKVNQTSNRSCIFMVENLKIHTLFESDTPPGALNSALRFNEIENTLTFENVNNVLVKYCNSITTLYNIYSLKQRKTSAPIFLTSKSRMNFKVLSGVVLNA